MHAIEDTSQFNDFYRVPGSKTSLDPIQLPVAFRIITKHLDRQLCPRVTGICVFTDRNHVPPATTYGDWSDYSNAVTFEVGKEIPTEEEEMAEEEENSEEVEDEPAEEVEEAAEQE